VRKIIIHRKETLMKSLCLLLATLVSAGCASSSQPVAETPPKPAPAPAAKLVLPTPPSPAAGQAAPAAKRVVVWDGEQANKGAGWTNPTTCTIGPQTAEVHSGNAAVEFKLQGSGAWLGAGWNWCAFQTGPYGTDITAMKNFTFWVKKKGTVADLQINLLCNGKEFDMPEHHTEKVSVLKYCPQLFDGQWHHVSIPLADFTRPKGFDPLHLGELQMFNAGAGDGSFFLDDLAFDDRAGDKQLATPTPRAFVWKGDCSSEAAFVNSNHATIPRHYEYEPDANEPGRGLVFAGRLTPDFTTTDGEKFHLHPDIYFDRFLPGSITVSFDVKVIDLSPSELGPYDEHPWLNVLTLFDDTTRAGGTTFHPSVMVNLVGTPGQYRLQAYSISAAGEGTFYDKLKDAPVFPTGKWVTVRVEVDVKTRQVRVYQDSALTSAGPYMGKPGLAGAHMGLYVNRKMTRATVFNDDITIAVGD
jgi:hypothetical protein